MSVETEGGNGRVLGAQQLVKGKVRKTKGKTKESRKEKRKRSKIKGKSIFLYRKFIENKDI